MANRFNKNIEYRPGTITPSLSPLAQSFIVGKTSLLTKIEIYFQQKDGTLPIKGEIRTIENGIPSNTVLPYSQVVVRSANVNISNNHNLGTPFVFSTPVIVEPGSYAFCLYTDSNAYSVWLSQINGYDSRTGSYINKQPNLGVLFKSTNSTTWTPNQDQDLKFRLFRAKFTPGATAVIDLKPASGGKLSLLDRDPFELVPNSTEMKVYHTNHGLKSGSYVINSLTSWPYLGNSDPNSLSTSAVYGLQPNVISGIVQLVSNVKPNSYTVTLSQAPTILPGITRFGSDSITAVTDIEYNTLFPAIGFIKPPGTTILQRVKPCNRDYLMDSSFIDIEEDDYTFNSLKIIPSQTNTNVFNPNTVATVYRIELKTNDSYIAPIIDTQKLGLVLFKNLINNPTYESENLSREKVTIYQGNNIGFTNLSNTTGSINLNQDIAKANAVSIVKGSIIEITGSNNTGNVRVLDIKNTGQNVIVYGSIVNEDLFSNANAVVKIVNGTQFISEEAAKGGSAISKYITRPVNFINPSIGFKLFLDVSKPKNTYLKFYYRTSLVGETGDIQDKEFIEITNITIPTSLSNEFYEIESLVDNIPQYDGIQLKIVFLSDDSLFIPKCKNLRLVSLA